MEWVEVKGKTVDLAVEVAMRELGVDDRNRVAIEVVQEPERGFLGIGSRDAIVRVRPQRPKSKRRRRRRGGEKPSNAQSNRSGEGKRPRKPAQPRQKPQERHRERKPAQTKKEAEVSVEEQAPVVEEFLKGLVASFGLEGEVKVSTDDDIIIAEVLGEQTEALVGPKGTVMEAVHELTKTVLQRKTQSSARVRLDVAGYAERRRQALTIYANQLIDQLLEEGGELMLEPMSAADRKVIHDAAAEREGVSTHSEGTAPQRYVVLVADESQQAPAEPTAESEEAAGEEE